MMHKKILNNIIVGCCVLGIYLAGGFSCAFAESIVNSKHNLSVSGPGTVIAQNESQICIFCHTPHSATSEAPLWNRYESGQIYTPYTSSTVQASIGQPTGNSKLCLSCHDGTVALGMVRSRSTTISFSGGISVMPLGETNLGTDLSDDHPVSFVYDSALASGNPELNDPAGLTGAVRLDQSGQMQCTSCHNPHDNQFGKFLNMSNRHAGLCGQCHNKEGWSGSSHWTSTQTWNSILPDPWPHTDWTTVQENGCENCHRPHGAGGRERTLNFVKEEDNCLVCHNGNAAGTNILSELNKLSSHPVGNDAGLHDPTEPALLDSPRHVECVDCHNPHAANDQDTATLPGSLRQMKGINASGAPVEPVSYVYEVCFRCHAETNKNTSLMNRQFPQVNVRLDFDPSNASYHPVIAMGVNPDVPSLKDPYTTSSMMTCHDCHNSDQGPSTGGTGPNGVHGSAYPPLLERRMVLVDKVPETAETYALCYKCHDRTSILRGDSFPRHGQHITGTKASCTTCHDPHGVKTQGHLINFDLNAVGPSRQGKLLYEDLGPFQGRCNLTCHNHNHREKEY